jgi:hypothetical protein
MASAFGVFQIVANDGRQDHMLMATELLNQRINRIKEVRSQAGFSQQDIYPSILDIERTHIIFVTAHFKPFAAIAFEYHKVTPNSQQLDGEIKYSIPQYGDFFGDMAHHVRFEKLTYAPSGSYADSDLYRYCDYPGERFHKEVKFDVNGNILDKYDSDGYVMNRQFKVAPNKLVGWKRLVGQEVAKDAFLEQTGTSSKANRVGVKVYDGYQTPKADHPALQFTVPMLLWFCEDFRLAVPSVAIPYGQRWLTITSAPSSDLVEKVTTDGDDTGGLIGLTLGACCLYVNNLFVNSEIHDIFIRRIGFTLIRVHLIHTQPVNTDGQRIQLNSLQWPIECLFFGFRPTENKSVGTAKINHATHPVFSKSSGFGTLQNWHRFGHTDIVSTAVSGVQGAGADPEAALEIAALVKGFDVHAGEITATTDWTLKPTLLAEFGTALVADNLTSPPNSPAALAIYQAVADATYTDTIPVPAVADDLLPTELGRQLLNPYREWNLFAAVANTLSTASAQNDAYGLIDYNPHGELILIISATDMSVGINAVLTASWNAAYATSTTVYHAIQGSGYEPSTVAAGSLARMEVRHNSRTVSGITFEAHNVKLYDMQYSAFFSDYLPNKFGGPKVNAPEDADLYFISFALYPGTYQPSGHLNCSRVREFYITAAVTKITNIQLDLLVYGSAINFLLIADGSASLRYTT